MSGVERSQGVAEGGKIAAIVLAAGRSDRMKYPKPLLLFGKETAVDHVIRVCRETGCDPVIVVLGYEAARIREGASLSGAEVVTNEAYENGRTSSLQAGIRALPPGTAGFLLFSVDHAMVEATTVAGLVSAYRDTGQMVIVPTYSERKGHPVVCAAALAGEFLALGPDAPARLVTGAVASRVHAVPTEDGEILRNMDTPADYYAALEVYSARGGEAGFLAPKGAGRPAPKRPAV